MSATTPKGPTFKVFDPSSQGGHSHARGHQHAHGDPHSPSHPGHGVGVERGFVAATRPVGTERSPLKRGAGLGKLLFLDMPSGIAGDMTIAALVDLGVPLEVVRDAVDELGLSSAKLVLESGYVGAVGCSHFEVDWPPQDGERNYPEIVRLISQSCLSDAVKELALRIFARLAQAEADVHRTTLDQVHFHEVGAVDAIVDIVGAAAAICYLGARVVASPVPLGRGFVNCRHGDLPLPAPATLNCLQGVPTIPSGLDVELVTPTGAAIVASVAEEFVEWPRFSPERIGWGAGTRGLPDRPNALRAILGVPSSPLLKLDYALLEANIDDMTGEVAAYALSRVLESGAVDAWINAVTMKKGRPGMVFSALVPRAAVNQVSNCIFSETSTIGVRQTLVSRFELARRQAEVETSWGMVRVKLSGNESGITQAKPELEDCAAIAQREGISLRSVLLEATRLATALAEPE